MGRDMSDAGDAGTRRHSREGVFPARDPRILWRETDGCAVLFHEEDGRAFALNETAAAVWARCDGATPVAAVAGALAPLWNMPLEDALRAVSAAVRRLADDGLLELRSSPATPSAEAAPAPAAAPWAEPSVEEIVFAACDCSGGRRGLMRLIGCLTQQVRRDVSVIG